MDLLMTRNFNGVQLDCYKADNEQDDFWATREQIGRLLGYADPMRAIAHIHERNQARLDKFSSVCKLSTVEGSRTVTREVIVYNFKGLLEICRFSNQAKANEVMDFLWNIADEIRRTGFYATPQKIEDILEDPDSFIRVLEAYKAEKARNQALSEQVSVQRQQIAELQPKASYFDVVLSCKELLSITRISKDYGWSAQKMNDWLKEQGVQYKRGQIWLLYQKYAEMGYTSTKTNVYLGEDGATHSKVHTYWTQKGRLFIYQKMKEAGHLPLIER